MVDFDLNPRLKNAVSQTPLQFVCEDPKVKDEPSFVVLLMKAGARLLDEKPTLLQSAIETKKYQIVELLQRQDVGFGPSEAGPTGTPLETAVLNADAEMVRRVMKMKNLDLDFACHIVDKDSLGKNLFHVIAEMRLKEILAIIVKENRAKVNPAKVKRYLNAGL